MPLSTEQRREIEALRALHAETRRPVVPQMEQILYETMPVLDHGFVRVVDYMGDDSAIVQAARVSYGRGTKKTSSDRALIQYLMRRRHTSPFEMCEIKLHVKLPIFIARQWVRHRTASLNEYSARYSILDREFYIPDHEHMESRRGERRKERNMEYGQADLFDRTEERPIRSLAVQSQENRQGREGSIPAEEARQMLSLLKAENARAYTYYTKLLNEDIGGDVLDPDRHGIARELARMILPANIYTQWYWKTDLHNLMHFVQLRAEKHAQYEIRAYAEVLLDVLRRWVPMTAEAFLDHRMNGVTLSGRGLEVVRRLLAGEQVAQADSGLGPREWRELMAALGREL